MADPDRPPSFAKSGSETQPPPPAPADRSTAPLGSAPLERAALERVLARAAELQAGGADAGDEFSDEQIIELGKEVGLSPQHLKQALAEERTRVALPPAAHDVGSQVFGPARVSASRTVPGNARDVLAAVDSWMQRQEWMIVKRQFGDRIVWEPRHDILGAVRRALNVGGRGYALSRAFEVAATVVTVDETRALVRLDADFTTQRRGVIRQTGAGLVVGVAASAALAVMGFFTALVPAPAILFTAGAFSGARSLHVRALTRAQLALEQLLDALERGELRRPATLLSALASAALPPRRG